MTYNNSINSRFNKIIRIKEIQLNWLKKNKDTKTLAGFLDIIINEYKKDFSIVDEYYCYKEKKLNKDIYKDKEKIIKELRK